MKFEKCVRTFFKQPIGARSGGRDNTEIKKNELMENEKFEMPGMEIVNLGMEDVITASCTADGCGCDGDLSEAKIGLCL